MDLVLLSEIKNGKSKVPEGWIKHPTIGDEALLDELNAKFLKLAIKRKIPLNEDALLAAEKAGSWTKKNQQDLSSNSVYLDRLRESYNKVIEAQKKYLEEDICKTAIKVSDLENKKAIAVGKTAENWASKLSSERYILSLFYKDEGLSEKKWSESESEFLDKEDVEKIFGSFFSYRDKFKEENLKSLSCSFFCQNLFSIAGDPFLFFGKSAMDLSSPQQRLILFISYYKDIIASIAGKVPEKTLSDWKELEKWAKSSERGREEMERSWGSLSGINDNINHENLKKASISKGSRDDKKQIIELLK